MFIAFDNITKKVVDISEKPFIFIRENISVAEYKGEIPKNDYLTVTNLRQETETWTEVKYEPKLDENGNEVYTQSGELDLIPIKEEKTRTYLACDLVANFYPPKTAEQLANEKEEKYKNLVRIFVRKKYSQDDVEAIYGNYLAEPQNEKYLAEFNEFQAYRNECKQRAKAEI